jgi:hypothetical protein
LQNVQPGIWKRLTAKSIPSLCLQAEHEQKLP